jgi:hypothetical protein
LQESTGFASNGTDNAHPSKLIQQGDVAGAYKALGDAKIWTYLSIGVGLLLILSRLAEAVGVYS